MKKLKNILIAGPGIVVWFVFPLLIAIVVGSLVMLTGAKFRFAFLSSFFLSQLMLITYTGLMSKDENRKEKAYKTCRFLCVALLLLFLLIGILIAAEVIDLRALYFKYIGYEY